MGNTPIQRSAQSPLLVYSRDQITDKNPWCAKKSDKENWVLPNNYLQQAALISWSSTFLVLSGFHCIVILLPFAFNFVIHWNPVKRKESLSVHFYKAFLDTPLFFLLYSFNTLWIPLLEYLPVFLVTDM